MGNKRIIPYGVINWATLVRECLFVDYYDELSEFTNSVWNISTRSRRRFALAA